jgi:hypothetical protein
MGKGCCDLEILIAFDQSPDSGTSYQLKSTLKPSHECRALTEDAH